MLSRAAIAVFLLVGPATGCGGSNEDRDGKVKGSSGNPRLGATLSPAERAPAQVALRYFDAVVAKDWEAACATRSKLEQREMARVTGSCAKAFAAIFKDKPVEVFEGVEARVVTIRGDTAAVEIFQPGQGKAATTVVAIRDGGAWRLKDVPDRDAP